MSSENDSYDISKAITRGQTDFPQRVRDAVETERARGADDDEIAKELLAFVRDHMDGEVSEFIADEIMPR